MIDRDDDVNGYGVDYGQFDRAEPYDYCVHGVYVGGCGIDFMCVRCESGAYYPFTYTVYRVAFSFIAQAGRSVGTRVTHELDWRASAEEAWNDVRAWETAIGDTSGFEYEVESGTRVGWSDDPKDQTVCARCGETLPPRKEDYEYSVFWTGEYCMPCYVEKYGTGLMDE